MVQLACQHCHAPFFRKSRGPKYCSRACRIAFWRIIRPCGYCGKPVSRKRGEALRTDISFCSPACKYHSLPPLTCLICGKQFRRKRFYVALGYGKYCSNICNGIGIRTNPDTVLPSRKSKLPRKQWECIKYLYGYRCVYCGKKPKMLTQEHLTPFSQGGKDTFDNIVPACKSCNSHRRTGPVLCPVQPLLLLPAVLVQQ